MTERALTEFRAAVRVALAAPLDGPLTARFVAPCVTALVVHADAGEELVAGLAEIIAALERVGVPRGRQYVLLAGDGIPGDAARRVNVLRDALGVPVLVHDASRAGFAAGRLPDGSALELDDELREAEAIVVLASIAPEHGGPWHAASLLCPGACTVPTRSAVATATSGDTGVAWGWVRAAEREAPIDLMVWWDASGIVQAASGRVALATWASSDAGAREIH